MCRVPTWQSAVCVLQKLNITSEGDHNICLELQRRIHSCSDTFSGQLMSARQHEGKLVTVLGLYHKLLFVRITPRGMAILSNSTFPIKTTNRKIVRVTQTDETKGIHQSTFLALLDVVFQSICPVQRQSDECECI